MYISWQLGLQSMGQFVNLAFVFVLSALLGWRFVSYTSGTETLVGAASVRAYEAFVLDALQLVVSIAIMIGSCIMSLITCAQLNDLQKEVVVPRLFAQARKLLVGVGAGADARQQNAAVGARQRDMAMAAARMLEDMASQLLHDNSNEFKLYNVGWSKRLIATIMTAPLSIIAAVVLRLALTPRATAA